MLPGLLISALSLGVVFFLADWQAMLQALRLANFGLAGIGFLLNLVWLGVRSLVWQALLARQIPYKTVLLTISEGYLLNYVLPFRLGEIGRTYLLGRKAGLDFWRVFPTILVERMMDLAMAVGLVVGSLPFIVGAAWARQGAVAATAVVLLGIGGLFLVARRRSWVRVKFERLAERWPILHKAGGERLPSFLEGLAILTDTRRFLLALGFMTADWLVAWLMYYVLLLAFIPGSQPVWAAFTLGIAALGIAAPSSPGALGVLELSIVGALAVFQVDYSTALAYALTAHMFNYIIYCTLGAYALAQEGETLTGLYRRLQEFRQSRQGA
jgi:uncharacterized protein (TIRG00374 family)